MGFQVMGTGAEVNLGGGDETIWIGPCPLGTLPKPEANRRRKRRPFISSGILYRLYKKKRNIGNLKYIRESEFLRRMPLFVI